MLNEAEFIKTMTGLCEIYGKTTSEFMFDVYYKIFQDYDIKQFNNAVLTCVKSNKYNVLPKPAEILEYLEGDKNDKALLAWVQAKDGVQRCGYCNTPDFKDPIISHCINELGGWIKFCEAEIAELPFIEKRFMDYYRLFLKRGIIDSKSLIGYVDLSNNKEGYKKIDKIKIGYEEKDLKLIN